VLAGRSPRHLGRRGERPSSGTDLRRQMRDDVVLAIGIIILAAVACGISVVVVALMGRRKFFAGPARDAWAGRRRELSRGDRLQVQRATMTRRPVGRPALVPAQLAQIGYALHVSERSPMNHWLLRAALGTCWGALGAAWIVSGIVSSQARVPHLVAGTAMALTAVSWTVLVPRSMARQPAQLSQLRKEIGERYPDAVA